MIPTSIKRTCLNCNQTSCFNTICEEHYWIECPVCGIGQLKNPNEENERRMESGELWVREKLIHHQYWNGVIPLLDKSDGVQ
jgi:hypothetical protein